MLKIIQRVQITINDLKTLRSFCERKVTYLRLPDKQKLSLHTFRGVPAKRVDLALTEETRELPLVLEINEKSGGFDSSKSCRLAVRYWQGTPNIKDHNGAIPKGSLFIKCEQQTVHVAVVFNGLSWSGEWDQLQSNLEGYDVSRIVLWHYSRYFSFLPFEEAESLSKCFESLHPELKTLTLAEANHLASNDLYNLARRLGWKKLDQRQKAKLGLKVSWMREEDYLHQRQKMSLVGEYTFRAACGDQDYIKTAHGIVTL